MKRLAILLSMFGAWAVADVALAAPPAGYQWQQVWGDEFNYTGMPDSSKWGYELGYRRNNEEQTYTNDPSNVYVKDGLLSITANKLATPVVSNGHTLNYSSASINTQNKFSVKYGRIEMSAKLPKSNGVWPAFWTLGTTGSWPRGGEIDIMEYYPNFAGSTNFTAAYHWSPAANTPNGWTRYMTNVTPYDGFHNYALEWSSTEMKFYFDNTLFATLNSSDVVPISGTDPFNNPQYLLLNLAMGGDWNNPIDPNFTSEKYQVDYVRVSQLVPIPEPGSLGILLIGALGLLGRRQKSA